MPVSAEMSRKKRRSKSEVVCDQLDEAIASAKAQIATFDAIKQDMGFEPGLLQKALGLQLGKREDLSQVVADMKEWKSDVKNEVRGAVLNKKQELKAARKAKRQNRKSAPGLQKSSGKVRKTRGGFI